MSNRTGILAGGNWIVDKVKLIDVYPQQDTLANVLSESVGNGGGPFNVLVDLARLGAPFPLAGLGLIGQDSEGDWITAQCARHDIDVSLLRPHESARTSYTDVMTVQSTGRRTFFHQRGANAFLAAEHFDFRETPARIFYLGYLLLLDQLDQPDPEHGTVAAGVLQRARAAGLKTCIDVVSEDSQRFAEIVLPALRHVDYCILNEIELERTTGIPTRLGDEIDHGAIATAARQLLDAGVKEWVIVHFPEGAVAVGPGDALHLQGSLYVPQVHIVGSVGAGDAFAAGVLLGLHEGVSIDIALKYGVTTAASCLYGASTSDSILPLEECLALGEKLGYRPL